MEVIGLAESRDNIWKKIERWDLITVQSWVWTDTLHNDLHNA